MSANNLETNLTRNTENAPRELLTRSFFFLCAALSVMTTLSIVGFFISKTAKFFTLTAPLMGVVGKTASIVDFLTGTTWQIHSQEFGVPALVSATLMVAIGSAIIALPLGVITTIRLSGYTSAQARSILKPALETLTGISTVVYGFFALIYITPAFEAVFPGIGAFNILSASVVVDIMIIPMVASISEDAMSVAPDELRQADYGMDATRFDVSTGIIVPAALSGIFSSSILALSRAIDETMAVTVATGAQVKFLNPLDPASYFEGALPMATTIVQLLTSNITGSGLAYRSLFTIGLVLFVITLAMDVINDYVSRCYREAY